MFIFLCSSHMYCRQQQKEQRTPGQARLYDIVIYMCSGRSERQLC